MTGGREGIVTHFAMVMVARQPHQRHRASAAIDDDRDVDGRDPGQRRRRCPRGRESSAATTRECEIEDNTISDVAPDLDSGDHTRLGVAIQAHYGAEAELKDNEISSSPGGVAAFVDATIDHKR